jgi:hypothetical protein
VCQQDWCAGQVFAPGRSPPVGFGFGGVIFRESSDVKIGGHDLGDTFDPMTPFTLNTSGGFTLPVGTLGSTFTACQPASMPISISGFAGSGDTFTNFVLQMPTSGKFCSTWGFVPPAPGFAGGYQFTQGTFTAPPVPEPSTLMLLGSGMAGILGLRFRKRTAKLAFKS